MALDTLIAKGDRESEMEERAEKKRAISTSTKSIWRTSGYSLTAPGIAGSQQSPDWGGLARMRLREGVRWICTNAKCRAECIVILGAKVERVSNPRCCCGSLMKRPYVKPILRTIQEPEELDRLRHLMGQNKK